MIGGLGLVVGLLYFATNPLLGDEFLDWQEMVGVKTQVTIKLVERLELLGRVKAAISDVPAHDRIVLFFDKAVVVFAVTPGAGKGYVFLFAVAVEVVIDELTAVI